MRVAVIGAGPAGLVSTKSLLDQGLEVTCFEMSSCIGGHWRINNPNGRSAAYESLTLNTTKQMSRLSDYELPADWPELPTHQHMYEWWCGYVDVFGFAECIRLSHEVLRIEPETEDRWRVQWQHDDDVCDASFDAIVLASGGYWAANMPTLPGPFDGEVMHAQGYRSPDQPISTKDKRVLVVGSSNTGCELALEISKTEAASVALSARSGNWILPKYVEGTGGARVRGGKRPDGPQLIASGVPMSHPLDEVPAMLRRLPERWREGLFSTVAKFAMRKQFGAHASRLVDAGMPAPPKNPLSKRAAIGDGLVEALEQGAIKARGAINHVSGRTVTFATGERETVDVIYFATGYRLSYPYVEQSVLDTADNDMVLYRGLMHPDRRTLFVVGVSRPSGGFWPVAEAQAQFVAQLLSGAYRLPGSAEIERATGPVLRRDSFNPALYGLALREELARGARRAERS